MKTFHLKLIYTHDYVNIFYWLPVDTNAKIALAAPTENM